MTSFAQEIQQLEADWGSKLLVAPEILWDEASVFRRTSFLAGSQRTQVTSMVPKSLEENGSSSFEDLPCISKSGSIQHIGIATAVLNIWPSSSFKKAWQAKQPICYQDCSGWVAQYEVWRHRGQSNRIIDIRIPLDPKEVWIQFKQSLRRRGKSLRTSFPLTIGDSLFCFMVLRTFFSVQPGDRGSDPVIKSALVEMDFLEEINRFWSLADRENSWFYTYSFRISLDGCRIFFSDFASNTTHGEIYSSNIAVLEIEIGERIHIESQAAGPVDDLHLLQNVLFHPSLSFVLLTYPMGVKIWNYKQGTSAMKFLWKREPSTWWNGDMGFSECGKFVLIAGQQDSIPLPREYLSGLPPKARRFSKEEAPHVRSEAVINAGNGHPFAFGSGQIMGSQLISGEKGTHSLSIGGTGSIELNLINTSGKKISGLHLLSTPYWNQNQEATQTIMVPEKDSTAFTIIMERGLERAYTFNSKQEENLPLVIKRDISDVYYEAETWTSGTKRRRESIMYEQNGTEKRGRIE
ncbi:hypothetical protein L207DRAFT_582239 [Hyaloscypha variabilis F]|uniref:Uncharacterized protein n=1 Tax=Hyaloscypha variabilis (strain UAMH 11265 / GT02V1 / F) TaxID=1149755 RepID=A0A2J6RTG4_HYAVF|nr:hypothetical protein L207DRAFT_582239 [Hyaloscypha variabilis F]